MLEIKEKFHNGIEECYVLTSTANKKILEKTNGQLYNCDISIVARRYNDYEESEVEREPEPELELEQEVEEEILESEVEEDV